MTSTGTADRAQPPAGTPDRAQPPADPDAPGYALPLPGSPDGDADGEGAGRTQPPAAYPLPLWWSRCFPGEPPQVRQARSWVASLLPACAPLDDLLIFTSELASNAITHTRSGQPGGRFTVEVTWTPPTARVVVGDHGSDEVPAAVAIPDGQDASLENGRGLLLIDMMSAAWGMAGDTNARWLWADVDWRPRGGPSPATPFGSNSAEVQFAATRCAYPGISAWYSTQPAGWHATLPGARDPDSTLTAPSPLALTFLLAAHYSSPDNPSRKAPVMTQLLCTCGYQAEDPADLTAHFGEMFIPTNDTAPDGQAHYENSQVKHTSAGMPAPATLTCRCGVTTNFGDFDQHLLDVFAPADRIGHDAQKHASAD